MPGRSGVKRAARTVACALLLSVALPVMAAPALSDLAQQVRTERVQAYERMVLQLSARIENGEAQGKDLAELFRNRGVARNYLLQYAEALQDFSRAVEIDQVNPQNYEDRAITHIKLREYESAARDLDMTLGLDSKRASAYREKGRLAFYQKDFYRASQEFSRALQHAEGDQVVYAVMWIELALRRGDIDRQGPIGMIAAQIQPEQWPAPVVQMLAGQMEPEAAIEAASGSNPRQTLMKQGEAYFNAAQQYLVRGERDKAKAAFEAAVATDVTEFMEYDWSVQELEVLGDSN